MIKNNFTESFIPSDVDGPSKGRSASSIMESSFLLSSVMEAILREAMGQKIKIDKNAKHQTLH